MKNKIVYFLAVLFFATPSILLADVIQAEAGKEILLSLDEALGIALRENRDILLKTEEVKKAKEKIAESKASLLPALSFTGVWADTKDYYVKDMGQSTAQFNLKQYLYKGSKTINTIGQSKDKLEVSRALLEKTKLEVELGVKKAFYTLALANELVQLNIGILGNTKEHFNFLQSRYNNGQASESDIIKMAQSLSNVEQAYIASENQAQAAESLLKNLLYLDYSVGIKTDFKFSYEPKKVAYDEAILQAMKTRPEIKQYQAQIQADKKAIDIAKGDNRPNIYASWDYYSRSHAVAATARGWNDYNVVGLTFSWPLFDGWATKHKVEQAIVDLKETELLKEKAIKDIVLELKNAYLDLENAIAKIKSAQSQVVLYRDILLVAQDKYKAGITSSLDLHDSSLGYDVALFNQKEAIYDYLMAKDRFYKATGGE